MTVKQYPIELPSPEKVDAAKDATIDKYRLTAVLFYVLATLSYAPSVFFITANGYWMYKFRNPNATEDQTEGNRTYLQKIFTSSYVTTRLATQIVSLSLGIYLSKKITLHKRMLLYFSIMLVLFGVTLTMVEVDTDTWQTEFFVMTTIIGVIIMGTSDMFYVTLIQMASKFPLEFLGFVYSGEAICGIGSAMIQVLSIGLGNGPLKDAIIYFSIGTAFVLFSIVIYFFVSLNSPYYDQHIKKIVEENEIDKITFEKVKTVFFKNKYIIMGMIGEYYVTTLVHPGITSLVESEGKGKGGPWNDIYFVPVITFLVYNIVAFIGRTLAIIIQPTNKCALFSSLALRILMIPLIMFCNAQPRHLPVFFGKDFEFIIFIVILSFSQGFLGTSLALLAASESSPEETYMANTIVVYLVTNLVGIFSFSGVLLVNSL